MGTSVNFEGFHEPSKTKTGYEFTIGKSEDEGLCRIDILFTDHSLELGKGNTVRIGGSAKSNEFVRRQALQEDPDRA